MRKTLVGIAAAGLLGGSAAVLLPLLPAEAAGLPTINNCLPPAGTPSASGSPITASGVIAVIGQQATSGTVSCSYTFTSTTAPQYGAATPNAYTITATHAATATTVNGVTTYSCPTGGTLSGQSCVDASVSRDAATDLQAGSPDPADATGTLTGTQSGDTVTVTVTLTCASQDPTGTVCGGIGSIAVGSPS